MCTRFLEKSAFFHRFLHFQETVSLFFLEMYFSSLVVYLSAMHVSS